MSAKRPNIVFIMSDDHAAHAMSCYGSRINKTPHIDRIAEAGMRFDNCHCTNAICTPSRAVILTGVHTHINGVKTLGDHWDNSQDHVAKRLKEAGYQTAIVGKWHLGIGETHQPTHFDFWSVLPGQGAYHDPKMIEMGEEKAFDGYVSDIITDKSIDWLKQRDEDKPFFLMCHHKAPHRPWEPDAKHAHMYDDADIPEPETFNDDYATRSRAAREARMRIDRDLNERDLKGPVPDGLTPEEEKKWKYQRYIKDYLRCVASIDDNVGRLLDYLQDEGIFEDTLIIYTSDQGFFLGDHNWFDKRFMYEHSLQMPFIVSYPRMIEAGSSTTEIITNLDFAPTWLELAQTETPEAFQGYSLVPLLKGNTPGDWQQAMYYRYWMHLDGSHNVCSHYGIRTHRYKLIYYYGEAMGTAGSKDISWEPEWELFDLEKDPNELNNVYADPAYEGVVMELRIKLREMQTACDDEPSPKEDKLPA